MGLLRIAAIGFSVLAPSAHASCFWSHVDHVVSFSDSGPWKTSTYRAVADAFTYGNVALALWEGTESRLGHTSWQAFESEMLSGVAANAGKYAFGRLRPIEAQDPCRWFESGGRSFPSGEAAFAAGLVAPYIFEYHESNPIVYSLLALPAWVGVGRIKNQAHWQSDVVTGWAIGAGFGWLEHRIEQPFIFRVLPGGAFVGFRKSF